MEAALQERIKELTCLYEIVKLRVRYNHIVGAECGKSMEQVTDDADRDFWLSPEQAREYGLVGRVIRNVTELG